MPSRSGHNTSCPYFSNGGLIYSYSFTFNSVTLQLAVLPDDQGRLAILTSSQLDTPAISLPSSANLRNHQLRFKDHISWLVTCQILIGDWNVRGKKTNHDSAGLHLLITFTEPVSHPRNHSDTDKVTHDYSSAVLPDWTAPKSLAERIHQHSLCPYSTSVQSSGWCWSCKGPCFFLFRFPITSLSLTPVQPW